MANFHFDLYSMEGILSSLDYFGQIVVGKLTSASNLYVIILVYLWENNKQSKAFYLYIYIHLLLWENSGQKYE